MMIGIPTYNDATGPDLSILRLVACGGARRAYMKVPKTYTDAWDALVKRKLPQSSHSYMATSDTLGVFDIVEYRPRVTKKGRILWRKHGVVKSHVLLYKPKGLETDLTLRTEANLTSRALTVCEMVDPEDSHEYMDAFKEMTRGRLVPVYGVLKRPLYKVVHVYTEDPSFVDQKARACSRKKDREGPFMCITPYEREYDGEIVPAGSLMHRWLGGIHNQECVPDDASAHEKFHHMVALKKKGYITA